MVAYLAPLALIGPLAGVFVDRWNPRVTMIASDLTRGVLIIFLAFTTQLVADLRDLFRAQHGLEFLHARAIGNGAAAR